MHHTHQHQRNTARWHKNQSKQMTQNQKYQKNKPRTENSWKHPLLFKIRHILKLVAASAAEAEIGALFLNAKESKLMRLYLR